MYSTKTWNDQNFEKESWRHIKTKVTFVWSVLDEQTFFSDPFNGKFLDPTPRIPKSQVVVSRKFWKSLHTTLLKGILKAPEKWYS